MKPIRSELAQTLSSAGLISLFTFGGAAIGFILQLLVAYYFGASAQTDAFFMAQSTSEMLSKLLLGGSIAAVFLPMFVERLSLGQKTEAWHLALNLIHLTSAALLLIIITLGVFAQPFVRFIAPGFDPATQNLTVNLIRVLLPSFLLLFLVQLITSLLHALKQFAIPAWLRVLNPIASIILMIALAPTLGIYALALGAVFSSVVQLIFLLWGLKKQGLFYQFIFAPRHPAIKKLVFLLYPFLASMLITQGAGIVYRILVSDLATGSLSALKFAEKITQFLSLMFLISVTTVIYPTLSEKAGHRDYQGMKKTLASSIRLISLVTVPLVIGVALLRKPIIIFIFQRGSFTPEDATLTSLALLFLVLGLTINGISSVFGYAVLALQETRAAVAVTIASQAIAIALFVLLVPPLAHAGLALASSLVPLAIALLYFLFLTRFIPRLYTIFFHTSYLKIAALATGLFFIVLFSHRYILNLPLPSGVSLTAQLIIPSLLGSLFFFTGAHLWRVEEMRELTHLARKKLKL